VEFRYAHVGQFGGQLRGVMERIFHILYERREQRNITGISCDNHWSGWVIFLTFV
jgi:hypothetical protein